MDKNKKKILVVTLVIVAIGGFIGFNVFNTNRLEAAGGAAASAFPVNWSYPSVQTIVSRVNARGSVELRDTLLQFPTNRTSAQIETIHVRVGDVVNAGDLLITYDSGILNDLHDSLAEARLALRSAELGLAGTRIAPAATELLAAENQIEQARNNIATIEAQIDQIDLQISQVQENIQLARSTQADVQTLFDSGVATRVELDNAVDAVRRLEDQLAITQSQRDAAALNIPLAEESERLAIAQLEAVQTRNTQPAAVNQAQLQQVSIERAQLQIAQIERNIDQFEREERAQVSGTILNIFTEEGDFSASGRPLLEVADMSIRNMIVIAHVPENEAGSVEVGQDVWISGAGIRQPGRDIIEVAARIASIHPLAAPQQIGTNLETVVTVEIEVIGTDRLIPGTSVDADIVTNINENTLVVPLMATLSEGGGVNFIYVINSENRLERRDIFLGEFSDMYIEIFGIFENDRIITSPTPQMYPGMHVRPLES